jgi:serine protease
VSPNLWSLIGSAYYPDVPPGSVVKVSSPGITWPAHQLPGPGAYCFVATLGNADDPAPNPANFATSDDFMNYIYANNNITWRNFNVVGPGPHPIKFQTCPK